MNTFTKKSLYAALAGVSALGVTGAADAVSVNPDGLGQVLIYPYYTVREKVAGAAYNTLLSVVNSTASAKAVKVRFLEGKNSREVLDFNLYLSAYDVWTAAILPTATGAGIVTKDVSCTTPVVSSSGANPTLFVNYQYTGNNADKADTSLDRTREGYIEIIEMGAIVGGSSTEDAVTHDNGVPSCDPAGLTNAVASSNTTSPTGGLFGSATLINVLAGEDYAYDATALADWSAVPKWTSPGSITPSLSEVNPKVSIVVDSTPTGFSNSGTRVIVTSWSTTSDPGDAVSALFMHDNVYNEFVLDAVTRSGTDWVLTMPTKRDYYASNGRVLKLFQRNFGSAGACDDVVITQFDREERTRQQSNSFSPPPPTLTDSICWEANVITFNNSNVLGSKNVANIATTYENGWVKLAFAPISDTGIVDNSAVNMPRHQLVGGASTVVFADSNGNVSTTTTTPTTFVGLPVLGFAAVSFNNGTIQNGASLIQSQYGGNFNHKYTRSTNVSGPAF